MSMFDEVSTNGTFDAREAHNLVSLKLQMRFDEQNLAIGTGFFYDAGDRLFIVTNWHNVSGRHPDTGKCLADHGGIPNRLTFTFAYLLPIPVDGNGVASWFSATIDLYKDDEMLMPVWFEHPTFGHRVDVVLIPVVHTGFFPIYPINDALLLQHDEKMYIHPSMDVFVLGFPRGMSGGGNFPIWKRGSIATEPGINLDGLPKFFIDTATRHGMSGAPVIAQKAFYVREDDDPKDHNKMIMGIGRRFIGVYSGRVGDDSFEAQLGIVWKRQVIDEIISSINFHRTTSQET